MKKKTYEVAVWVERKDYDQERPCDYSTIVKAEDIFEAEEKTRNKIKRKFKKFDVIIGFHIENPDRGSM